MTIEVPKGASTRITRRPPLLPPLATRPARTPIILAAGSGNGSSFTTMVAATGYTFNPTTGNSASITIAAGTARYLRLTFTGNTVQGAGQAAEVQIFG